MEIFFTGIFLKLNIFHPSIRSKALIGKRINQ